MTTYERFLATAELWLRRAREWVASVTVTAAPHSETEEEHEQKEMMRIKRIAELNLWMKRKARRPGK